MPRLGPPTASRTTSQPHDAIREARRPSFMALCSILLNMGVAERSFPQPQYHIHASSQSLAFPMAITRSSSVRSSSPTPSDDSDRYYRDFDGDTPSPAPSQVADALGWDPEGASSDSRDVTPTPQIARTPSPTPEQEITAEAFPALPTPTPVTVPKPRAKAAKAKKGKGRAEPSEPAVAEPTTPVNGQVDDDPFLAADIARATAASLGLSTEQGAATSGASSSRRPAAAPGSPSKRQRSNTAGDSTARGSAPAVANGVPNVVTSPAPASRDGALPNFTRIAATSVVPGAAQYVSLPPWVPSLLTHRCRAAPAQPNQSAAAAAPAAAMSTIVLPAPPGAVAGPDMPASGAALPPMWLTADGLPPRGSYTPTPAGGWAAITYEPSQLLQGVPPELIVLYEGVPSPKIFLVVSGGNGAVMRTHGLIREAIGNFINIDPNSFTLSTPPVAANGSSPALWLLADLPGGLTQAILDNRVLSSTAITLFPLPYELPVAGFVGVFAGFTLPNTVAGANAARDLIRTALRDNSEIREFVHTHRSAYGPVAASAAWEILLASLVVEGIELIVQDTHTVAWRLHVSPPTTDRAQWGQFRRLFGKLQILTLHGTARLQRPFRCHICPSVDHPTPLCPFPVTPDWLGPTHDTIAVFQDASRAAAAKAQEQMCPAAFDAGSSNFRGGTGRGRGAPSSRARRGGGGKRGGDHKGKGRQQDDFF
ncbi:hypothetical protein GGX14DRAFT_391567 [Mycena pura]|uniref:Uncharacterized protein n=1 Tax=Mycena pura TaxID=153505 RepID=A0AAD6VKN2_9AGAR|nr:hypothetical protein GGX14DRAFT_391567 [Mycena pura]